MKGECDEDVTLNEFSSSFSSTVLRFFLRPASPPVPRDLAAFVFLMLALKDRGTAASETSASSAGVGAILTVSARDRSNKP